MMIQRRTFLTLVGAGGGALALTGCGHLGARADRAHHPHAAFFEAIRRDDATAVAALLDREPKLLEAQDERGRSGFGVAP